MKIIFRHPALLCTFWCALLSAPLAPLSAAPVKKPAAALPAEKAGSVVRVNSTNQAYDFLRPWSKRPPIQYRAVGAVLPGSRVLTTAEQVANSTYLELEKPDSGEKSPATVEVVDYDCNLALLKASDPAFLAPFKPLALAEAAVGDQLTIWQLEANGTLLNTRALLTTVEVGGYPVGELSLLLYRLSSSLQPRDGGFTSPVVKNGALAGMLLRFDSRSQTADAIPAPIIRHFLKAASAKEGYIGFPRAGFVSSALRDPQLRRYAGLTNGNGGVYITDVTPGGPAEKAGIQTGDVLLSIAGQPIDRDGHYLHPHYGKLSMTHLLSCEHYDGEKLRLVAMRQGKEISCELTLAYQDPSKSVIEPYSIGHAPRYYILGGLIFQELSRQFLREWGKDWIRKAPERFLYLDAYQKELFRGSPCQRVVIMSNVLPTPCTIGYEELNCLVVTKINGVALKSLADIEPALAQPREGFHHIEFQGHPGEIVIDAAQASAIEKTVIRNYGLPGIKRL